MKWVVDIDSMWAFTGRITALRAVSRNLSVVNIEKIARGLKTGLPELFSTFDMPGWDRDYELLTRNPEHFP